MPNTQVPCHGCSRFFALCGLSQHVAKSLDLYCQSALKTSQVQVASSSIQHAAMLLLLEPNNIVPISNDSECGELADNMEILEDTLIT